MPQDANLPACAEHGHAPGSMAIGCKQDLLTQPEGCNALLTPVALNSVADAVQGWCESMN